MFHVVLPVAVASSLVCLAVINMALVKAWKGELEDGVRWSQNGVNVLAAEVNEFGAGHRSGVHVGDVLVAIDGREVVSVAEVVNVLHASEEGQTLRYSLLRPGAAANSRSRSGPKCSNRMRSSNPVNACWPRS